MKDRYTFTVWSAKWEFMLSNVNNKPMNEYAKIYFIDGK